MSDGMCNHALPIAYSTYKQSKSLSCNDYITISEMKQGEFFLFAICYFNKCQGIIDIQRNRLRHLENTLVMYGVYNAETLEKLIKTVHALHSRLSMYEK